MKNKLILLNVQEYQLFKKVCPAWRIDYARYNDPAYQFGGAKYWAVYLTHEMSLTELASLIFTIKK